MKRCLALITIACFLAEIRCHYSQEAHDELYKPMLDAMDKNGLVPVEIDVNQDKPINNWCNWASFAIEEIYDSANATKTQKASALKGHEKELGIAVRRHVENYFHRNANVEDSGFPTLCFGEKPIKPMLYHNERNKPVPLVVQLMRFAFRFPKDVIGHPDHDSSVAM